MASTTLWAQEGAWQNPEFGALVDVLVARGLLGPGAVEAARRWDGPSEEMQTSLPLESSGPDVVHRRVLDLIEDSFRWTLSYRMMELFMLQENPRFAAQLEEFGPVNIFDSADEFSDDEVSELRSIIEEEGLSAVEFEFMYANAGGDIDPYPSVLFGVTSEFGVGRSESPTAYIQATFSVIGKTRRKLIDLIEELEIVPSADVDCVRADLEAGLIPNELMLIRVLLSGERIGDLRDKRRSEARVFVDTLLGLGILRDDSGLAAVRAVAEGLNLQDDYALKAAVMAASPIAVHLEVPPPDEPLGDRYVSFLQKLSTSVPALRLSALQAHTRDTIGLSDYDWILALGYKIDGQSFRDEMRRYVVQQPNTEYGSYIDPDYFDVDALIDRLHLHLAQQNVDIRLLTRDVYDDDGNRMSALSILPINRHQATRLAPFGARSLHHLAFGTDRLFHEMQALEAERREQNAYAQSQEQLLPPADNFDFQTPQRSVDTVATFVSAWRALGLLEGLTEEEIEESTARAPYLTYAETPGWLYRCFPRRVVYFDWEGAESDGAYGSLLLDFERAGRGKFMLINVRDDFPAFGDDGPYPASFELAGKTYRFSSRGQGDWLDGTFLNVLQGALEEQTIGGRFYQVVDDGQASGFAFFTDEETAALRAQMPGMIQEPERD